MASTSVHRRTLLERLGIPFGCVAPGTDETPLPGEDARRITLRLARDKATAVAEQAPDAVVIGSDQVAVLTLDGGERMLGKPGTAARAVEQLTLCSGRTVLYLTAVSILRHCDGRRVEFVDTTRVAFRVLDAASVERYVARESPLDCAGAFKSEGLGISLCESIDSADPSALIGLPLIRLSAALRDLGFALP